MVQHPRIRNHGLIRVIGRRRPRGLFGPASWLHLTPEFGDG